MIECFEVEMAMAMDLLAYLKNNKTAKNQRNKIDFKNIVIKEAIEKLNELKAVG